MTFLGKFVYIAHHFNFLRLSPSELVSYGDWERWWSEHPVIVAGLQRVLYTHINIYIYIYIYIYAYIFYVSVPVYILYICTCLYINT